MSGQATYMESPNIETCRQWWATGDVTASSDTTNDVACWRVQALYIVIVLYSAYNTWKPVNSLIKRFDIPLHGLHMLLKIFTKARCQTKDIWQDQ